MFQLYLSLSHYPLINRTCRDWWKLTTNGEARAKASQSIQLRCRQAKVAKARLKIYQDFSGLFREVLRPREMHDGFTSSSRYFLVWWYINASTSTAGPYLLSVVVYFDSFVLHEDSQFGGTSLMKCSFMTGSSRGRENLQPRSVLICVTLNHRARVAHFLMNLSGWWLQVEGSNHKCIVFWDFVLKSRLSGLDYERMVNIIYAYVLYASPTCGV